MTINNISCSYYELIHNTVLKNMAQSVTLSFSAPLELSIQMEEYMENTKLNRSELIKEALVEYFKSYDKKVIVSKLIENTYKTVLEIKKDIDSIKNKNGDKKCL